MKTPRVAHLVYDLIRGGTEGQCARVAMGLAGRGWVQRVAAFHRRGFFLERVEAACGAVHEVGIRRLARLETLREIRRLAEWLCRERIDLLHAWDADAAIFGQFAARWAGVGFATSRRDLGQIYPRWKMALMRRADGEAVKVVANAEAIRGHFAGLGLPRDKIVVLPNLLDLAEFDEEERRPFKASVALPEGRRLVAVNRLDPEKNVGLLLEALVEVRRREPAAALVVAGAGSEMEPLRKRARDLGIENAAVFLGEVSDVPALLRQCEAGALVPLRNEGLSNTILEYMAAALPVLATDCGGNRELVEDGTTGRLISAAASPGEVAEAWLALLDDRGAAAAMGRAGRARVELRHAPTVALDAFARFYSEVATSSKRPSKRLASEGT